MKANVSVSPRARTDIRTIIAYLDRNAGPVVAADYAQRLRTSLLRLTEFPEIGTPQPHLGEELRSLVIPPYLVFYRFSPHDNTALVLRVLHGRRKKTAKLFAT